MRAFVVFLFVAGGVAIATGASSAQEIMAPPVPAEANGSFDAAPSGHCFCHCGIIHPGCLLGRCLGGGCCDNGNCACHGSYKYPVPSQYTYFWPGIYSQQAMTQYVSPWRYPNLNPIPENWKLDPSPDEPNPYSGYRY